MCQPHTTPQQSASLWTAGTGKAHCFLDPHILSPLTVNSEVDLGSERVVGEAGTRGAQGGTGALGLPALSAVWSFLQGRSALDHRSTQGE